jgi:hypothetical protein
MYYRCPNLMNARYLAVAGAPASDPADMFTDARQYEQRMDGPGNRRR